jgi:hypothetical protein
MSLLNDRCEQSRLVFNGPAGCYKQLAGLLLFPTKPIVYFGA